MLTDDEIDFAALDHRALSPHDWDVLRRRAIERAHRTRSELAKALARQLIAAIRQGLIDAVNAGIAALAHWRSSLAANRDDRAAIARLHALDDCALKDIGIRRTEIESIVHAHGNDDTRARRNERMAA